LESKTKIPVTAMSIKMQAEIVSYGNGILNGKLYSRFLDEPYEFPSVVRMIEKMEQIFDSVKFPQAFLAPRSFREKNHKTQSKTSTADVTEEKPDTPHVHDEPGANCTFEISVRFRQNATWQGQIHWVEKDKKQDFLSVLEMLRLVNDALSELETDAKPVAWGEQQ